MIDPKMSVEIGRAFANISTESGALAIPASKVVTAAVLPKLFLVGEVLGSFAKFARNVESRGSAMFQEGFRGSKPCEASGTPANLGIVFFAVNWITYVWRIRDTQTFAVDRNLNVIVVVGSSERW